MKARWIASICAAGLLALPIAAPAQAVPGGGNGQYGNRGTYNNRNGGQPPDPAQISQMIAAAQGRQLDRLKTEMGMSDADFAAIQPMMQKLLDNQMSTRVRRGGAMFRGANPAAQNAGMQNTRPININGQPQSELQQAVAELEKAAADQTNTPQLIEAKIAAVHAARDRQNQDTAAIEDQLRSFLTFQQEAVLTINGLLPW